MSTAPVNPHVPALERLCADLLAAILAQAGATPAPPLDRWLAASRAYLAGRAGDGARDLNALWRAWEEAKAAWAADPLFAREAHLLEDCLGALPDILAGRRSAQDILFPDGSLERVSAIHRDSALARHFNILLADRVAAYARGRVAADAGASLRILEVGGGVGGTTTPVLEALAPFHRHLDAYCFTDLSNAFLHRAQERFGAGRPFFSTRLFDLDKPAGAQGIAADGFDVVIAANVLHVARDVREAVRHLKAVLHRGGLLFINELSAWSLFAHLTFGLLPQWWAARDPALRIPGSPGLSPERWEEVLTQEGFPRLAFPARADHGAGQQIIIAESDGVVRHPACAPPAVSSTVSVRAPSSPPPAPAGDARAACAGLVTRIVAETLKVPPARLDPAKPLEAYGLDSILAIQLAKAMRAHFSSVRTTLFFEANSIDALVEHFMAAEHAAVANLAPAPVAAPAMVPAAPEADAPAGDIAIIGLAGRFPGAADLDQFWTNVLDGRDAITPAPAGRWNGPGGTAWGGFLDGVELFDPLFFDISPREAALMPPEERLFLETVWTLFEATGHTRARLRARHDGRVGVFVGAMFQHYRDLAQGESREVAAIATFSAIANRVSRVFDLHGPSLAVDTMCSASAVALHLACESLKSGACALAVAGGVNLSLWPGKFAGLARAGLIGSGPHSRSFAAGDGYLPAEAVGAALLKPLARARADGDEVLAVIKASAVNHDGATAGMAVPNPKAQRRLVEDNFRRAGIDPRTIGHVEAAANGSALGDALEVEALAAAFRAFTPERGFCALGTVKSTIGHPEAASGIAQLAKVVLQLRHRRLVPTIKAWPLNPDIRLEETAFRLEREARAWEPVPGPDGRPLPLRAAISSFGGGGANAHLILEEAPPAPGRLPEPVPQEGEASLRPHSPTRAPAREMSNGAHALVLSARTPAALRAMAARLRDHLADHPGLPLDRMAHTLQLGREAMEERLALVAASRDEIRQGLAAFLSEASGPVPSWRGRVDLAAPAPEVPPGAGLADLARRWVAGEQVDWAALHPEGAPPMLPLPTYPFERERCWLPGTAAPERADVREIRLAADHPWLRDHGGALPAVCHLVLVRRVLERPAAGLRRVVWLRPAMANADGLRLRLELRAEADGLRFEIRDGAGQVSCRGEVVFDPAEAPAPLDLTVLGAAAPGLADREACDRLLLSSNGPSLMPIAELRHGPAAGLARLRRPAEGEAGEAALLNGAVLAALAWSRLGGADGPLPMPFALEALDLHGPLPDEVQAHVRRAGGAYDTKSERYLRDPGFEILAPHLGCFRGADLRTGSGDSRNQASRGLDPKPALIEPISYDVDLAASDGRVLMTLRRLTLSTGEPVSAAPAPDAAPAGALGQELADMLRAIQGIAPDRALDPAAPWSRYGLGSLGFAEFTERLNRRFGLALMPTVFFEHTSLTALEQVLAGRLSQALRPGAASAGPPAVAEASLPIAIVGVGARLPGGETLDAFWEHLAQAHDLITEIPADRWDWRALHGDPHREPGRTLAKWGGFLDHVDRFDPRFFGLSPRDAEAMDPQSRLVLEAAWAALEDAGQRPGELAGRPVGVFIGVSTADYKDICQAVAPHRAAEVKPFLIANRVSYHLDLRGPSEVVDTACSSSLVALNRAVEAIRRGTCEAALAGGVNVILTPDITLSLGRSGVLSEDGRCMAFDSRANGMVRGEGVGVVLLKPLAEAVRAGDPILGIIRGSAENQDGRSSSAAAPNPLAQRDLIVRAVEDAGIDPRTLTYVEAHGTGTELGDPVEIRGLAAAFEALYRAHGLSPPARPHCAVGSVKTNIGHLEAAAGIAGVIKVLLMFRHAWLPGNVHLRTPNPYLELAESPLELVREGAPWPRPRDARGREVPRRAGVSSFGIGGTNAHVILEEYRAPAAGAEAPAHPLAIPLSAWDEPALRRKVAELRRFLEQRDDVAFAGLVHTLRIGREDMAARLGLVAASVPDLVAGLNALEAREAPLSGFIPPEAAGTPLERWVGGASVGWGPPPEGARRIRLPTYPFARERHWVEGAAAPAPAPAEEGVHDRLLCRPVWRPLQGHDEAIAERLLLLCGPGWPRGMEQELGVSLLSSDAPDAAARFEDIALAAFERIRALLEQRPRAPVLVQFAVRTEGEHALLAGLSGLAGTAARENSRLLGQMVECEPGLGLAALRDALDACARRPREPRVRVRSGGLEALAWREVPPPAETAPAWRPGGVYLITGGTGGLGLIFARDIAAQAKGATLVLAGRSRPTPDLQARLDALGCAVHYRQVDVGRKREVDALVAEIERRWGPLTGVLHAAGVTRGRYMIKKSAAEFRAVLAPKVAGAWHLDQATRHMALDLFVLFSSGAGSMGFAGQSDYAAANGFLDQFAAYRAGLVAAGARAGRTCAVSWPLWQDGGMRVDPAAQAALRADTGMAAMARAAGVTALHEALALDLPHVAVIAGDVARIRASLLEAPMTSVPVSPEPVPARAEPAPNRRQAVLERLQELMAREMKLAADEIAADQPLERYGIDSIVILRLNPQLEAVFGPISKTLLFEFQTLGELADHVLEDFPRECAAWVGEAPAAAPRAMPARVTQARRASSPRGADEPIAIVGMAARFPEAPDLDSFWRNLDAGRDCIRELPADRWPLEGFFDPDPDRAVARGMSYGKWGGFLEGVTEFDPLFFNISPREALAMDPQERLFLEVAHAAVEDAGYCRDSLKRVVGSRVGVFAGITKTGFDLFGPELWRQGRRIYPHTSFGSVANRVSYLLDLKGPSMPVDTLCSSSLTALHEGCAHILRGECDMALVGGVNIYLHPSSFTSLSAHGFLARGHRCRSFGRGGDGFVPGEGVAVVVLKRLSQAERDGDAIHALVRGTAVNHDGKTNGYTVPNPRAQTELVRRALDAAGVDARDVGYVEAHGTGTELGDPIEITGLTQAFRRDTPDCGFAAIGSVKSNIGHLEAAAGMAGLIKIILQMRHGRLAPSLHADELNPHIDFSRTPFTLQREGAPWMRPVVERDGARQELERIACLSSFGAGGSNAHAVIADYAPPSAVRPDDGPVAIPLSARDEESLRLVVADLLPVVEAGRVALGDLAYTLQVGREARACRLALVAHSRVELASHLRAVLAGGTPAAVRRGRVRGGTGQAPLVELLGEEEAAAAMARWTREGRLDKLVDHWVEGVAVTWDDLPRALPPRRVSLPASPFRRQRLWFDVLPALPSGDGTGEDAPRCFHEVWEPAARAPGGTPVERLVCCLPPGTALAPVEAALERRGVRHVCLAGDPADQAEALAAALEGFGGAPDRVLFLGTGRAEEAAWIATLLRLLGEARAMPAGLMLAGAPADAVARCHVDSWIGFERTLRLSRPELAVAVVVLEAGTGDWLAALWPELEAGRGGAVSHAGGTRHELRLKPLDLGAPVRTCAGAILITGGMGGLGLMVARHLAARGGVDLILAGRSPLDAVGRAAIGELEALGARVLHLAADVTDAGAMAAGLAQARLRFGPIRGVIHAAGVQAAGSVFENDRAAFLRVTAPKVEGALILDRLLADDPLDFVCHAASSAAILGDFGSCDYAVANRFLMAHADMRPERRIAIGWPLWRDGRMGQGAPAATALYLRASGQRLLEREEGLDLLDRLLGAGQGAGLVLAGTPPVLARMLERPAPAAPVVRDCDAVADTVEAVLRQAAADVLSIAPDRLEGDRNLADFGFDSVSLAEYAKALSGRLGIAVAPVLFYGHPTLDALADHFMSAHGETLRALCAPQSASAGDAPSASLPADPMPVRVPSAGPAAPARATPSRAAEAPEIAVPAVPAAPPSPVQPGRGEEPIAIIGMGGRFPGADTPAAFWRNVRDGIGAIGPIPPERRDGPLPDAARGAFIDGVDRFDPLFFEIPPSEADEMDPRQRLFLEVAWETLEDAGALGARIRGADCGVFVGVEEGLSYDGAHGALNSGQNATLPARIAYLLDLAGPTFALTSACSSALVALHQACMALRQGDCATALVGGVNIMLATAGFEGLRRAGLLSADGRCAVFDRAASGLVPGEAVAAVLLKPLSAALRDGDRVRACITGSAVNHDGRTNGITAPNPVRQAMLAERLFQRAGVDPADVQLVMAHSVGSPQGDPVEIEALAQAMGRVSRRPVACAVASVKPLVGHGFAASGLVSLIATVLALEEAVLPGLPHEALHEAVAARGGPFVFEAHGRPWPAPPDGPRRALVGATGISGTNAAVLLEQAPRLDVGPSGDLPSARPFLLSARTPDEVRASARRLAAHLRAADPSLADIAFTLALGREPLRHRMAVVAARREDLIAGLDAFVVGTGAALEGEASRDRRERAREADAVAQALERGDPEALARLWCAGAVVPWAQVVGRPVDGRAPRMTGLPTYPFTRRACGRPLAAPSDSARSESMSNSTVAELYGTIAALERPEFKEGFLTFFPLLERRPGFSITRVGLHPELYPQEVALIRDKQRESRRVLMADVDFSTVERVLDFGCGYGADLQDLAERHPHLVAHGYTITPAQARLANERLARTGLSGRVRVFNRDSTIDPFPETYDLVLGIEVCCHIAAKEALFRNVMSALKPGGRVLLMDFVAHLRGAIVDPRISVHIPTAAQWVDLISAHGLLIEESVDLSAEIANSITDPECEANTRDLPPVLRESWRNWTNNAVAIERGWVGYRLFKLRRADGHAGEALRAHNQARFDQPTPYRRALAALEPFQENCATLFRPELRENNDLEHFRDSGKCGNALAETAPSVPAPGRDPALVRARLAEIFQRVLRLSAADLAQAQTLRELGLASLNAVALLEAINTAFALDLPTSVVFEFATLDDLAAHIAARITPAVPRPPVAAPSRPPVREPTRGADAIAIIGLACRCAGAGDVDGFWDLVRAGRSALTRITDPAWLDYFARHSTRPVPLALGQIADKDKFDPLFFRISPKEADAMGLVQRLLLEEAYHALESAGHAPAGLRGQRVGTYMGLGSGVDPEDADLSHLAMLGVDTSIAAARIAFLLDLKGPALAVNTACSSSLVAVDLAVKALRQGEVDLALAGGITLWDHPAPFVSMTNAGMLSPTGACRPFDADADGIVVGDGVGVVVLKRLAEAQRDGDVIHAVIRGSGTNQDGRTSGITVPSFLSQSRLQADVYAQAGIDARDIHYVEAHGTATKLGDPVEIHALTESFGRFTGDKGFCRIGSVKANIGHTAAAAGILSLIKAVRALEHREIPPSLNFARPNEHIDFDASPVRVSHALEPWAANRHGRRLAAVSSFGYSGTNAHVVLEDYPAPLREPAPEPGAPHLVVLSARDRERLKAVAGNLKRFLAARRDHLALADVAYTLQVGRDGLDERVAFLASTFDELLARLHAIACGGDETKSGRSLRDPGFETFAQAPRGLDTKPALIERISYETEGFWWGRADGPDAERLSLLDDEDAAELVGRWLAKGKVAKLAQLWVGGLALDWGKLQAGTGARRVRLPGYPFARRACRVPPVGRAGGEARLHPLVHRNRSGLTGLRFSSTFTGREPFLADHRIEGVPVLPAVAYLEMARAALAAAGESGPLSLRNILWARPLAVRDAPVEAHVTLAPAEPGRVKFEIETTAEGAPALVHARGLAVLGAAPAPAPLDLVALRARLSARRLEGADCYAFFAARGVDYGPAHRVIETVMVGEGEVLARLALAEQAAHDYVLHPSLLDGALQAAVGLVLDAPAGAGRPMLPFALDALHAWGRCPAVAFAWIRRSPDRPDAGSGDLKLDIDLCDEAGGVQVRLAGLVSRTVGGAAPQAPSPLDVPSPTPEPARAGGQVLICRPVWEPRPVPVPVPGTARRVIVPVGLSAPEADALGRLRPDALVLTPPALSGDMAGDVRDLVLMLFGEIRDWVRAPGREEMLVQVAVPGAGAGRLCAAVSGLLRTAHRERPRIRGQVVEWRGAASPDRLAELLDQAALTPDEPHLRSEAGGWRVERWREAAAAAPRLPWRADGVYLISGGLGGLGLLFAREIAARAPGCRLVLAGRSEPDAAVGARIAMLRAAGAQVDHRRVDMADASAVAELVRFVLERHGRLDGVLHAAGVIRDGVLANKSAADVAAVLAPKVAGAVHLDAATAGLDLDLFLLFSSGAGAWGNAGQADYATANAFLDLFAEWRNGEAAAGRRRGRAVSVNWPLWKDGGMRVDAAAIARMERDIGAVPLETEAGFAALHGALGADLTRFAVMQGDGPRLRAAGFGAPEEPAAAAPPAAEMEPSQESLRAWITHYLSQVLCDILGVQPSELDPDRNLSAYGLDSIMVMDINNHLETCFADVPQTLFFEHGTLRELVAYFMANHAPVLRRLAAATEPSAPVPSAPPALSLDEMIAALEREAACAPDIPASQTLSPETPKSGDPRELFQEKCDPLFRPELPKNKGLEHFRDAEKNGNALAELRRHSPFHSVAPLCAPLPGFSLSRSLVEPESCGSVLGALMERQADLRRVMFQHVDLQQAGKALDLGCGIGADLIALASGTPGLVLHGLTVSPQDAAAAEALIRARGLQDRVRIEVEDNTQHAYEDGYGLIFSIQTLHFVTRYRAKRMLFARLASALRPQGHLVMAEYVGALVEPLRDSALKATVHTEGQWVRLLADAGLALDEVIDLSAEVLAFLHDPDLERTIRDLEPERQRTIRKLVQQGATLERGWARFLILKARRAPDGWSADALTAANLARLQAPRSYGEALRAAGPVPGYDRVRVSFPEFLAGEEGVP